MSSLSPLDMKWPYWFHFYVFLLREKSSSFKLRWWGLLLKRKWIKVYNKAFTYYILFLLNCIVLLIFNKLGEALSVTRYQLGTLLHKWPKAPRSMGGWIFSQKGVELLNRVDKIKWGAETPLHTLISDEKLECLRERASTVNMSFQFTWRKPIKERKLFNTFLILWLNHLMDWC